jgi:hypothetical protein
MRTGVEWDLPKIGKVPNAQDGTEIHSISFVGSPPDAEPKFVLRTTVVLVHRDFDPMEVGDLLTALQNEVVAVVDRVSAVVT